MPWMLFAVLTSGAIMQTAGTSEAFEWVRTPTADGADLALKHRPAAGPPVILVHGIAVHSGVWDLPDMRGEDYEFRSLATVLQEAGYDVWLVNLRGAGPAHHVSRPPPGQTDWCVDHFVLYDLPATTGGRPTVIASSMGAMALAGHLQGAVMTDGDAPHIVADVELARRRQAALAGAVFVEFPAALRWPNSLYKSDGRLDWAALARDMFRADPAHNYPFEALSRVGWLEAIVAGAGAVPVEWLASTSEALHRLRLPEVWAQRLDRGERAVMRGVLRAVAKVNGGTHHRVEIMLEGKRRVLENIKAGVLAQMAASVRKRSFVSTLGAREHDYTQQYGSIELPILVIAGGRDRIANADVTREILFDAARSNDKTFLFFDTIGHGEFTAAPIAYEEVYPRIEAWIAERAK
jgi:alpha-beta hydrolase superfamily lysophospholipase